MKNDTQRKVVGPGANIIKEVPEGSLLDGANEYEYVTILNPLTDDFQVQIAQDIPINMPFQLRDKTTFIQSEQDVRQNYGLNLKNPDHVGKKYIYNTSIIPAGKTINFRGNEAQVAVRQLVNEIIQREGSTRFLADPVKRREVEERIIIRRGNVQELMDAQMVTPSQQIDEALHKSNEVAHEQFPGLADLQAGADSPVGGEDTSPEGDRKRPGRKVSSAGAAA